MNRRRLIIGFSVLALLFSGLWGGAQAWGSEQTEVLLARGTRYYLNAEYARAREQLVQAAALDPTNLEIKEMLGLTLFGLKEYQEAGKVFSEILSLDPSYPKAKLYLGATLFQLRKYEEARQYLREAHIEDPKDALAQRYVDLAVKQEKQETQAKGWLFEIFGLPPQYAGTFVAYGASWIAPREKAIPVDVQVATGIQYDDNIKVLPDHSTVFPTGYAYYGNLPGHKSQWRIPVVAQVDWLPLRRENLALGLKYSFYSSTIPGAGALKRWNVLDSLAEVYLKYQQGPVSIWPFYGFDLALLGGERFSVFNNTGVRISLTETPYLRGDFYYCFQDRSFRYLVRSDYKRTGSLHTAGFFQTWQPSPRGALRLGLLYGRELAVGENWTNNSIGTRAEVIYTLPYQIGLWGAFVWYHNWFDHSDTVFGKHRNEDYLEVAVQLQRPITPWLSVMAGYTHISNLANIQDYQYQRNIYQLLLSLRY